MNQLDRFINTYKPILDQTMITAVNELKAPSILKESMRYSLEAGGKRIRPLLLFAAIAAFEKKPELGLTAAASLEMIHTYSLVHDDLPSMDDDDLRRGKPTNHKVFGEAIAILAGDGLLTYSFQLIAEDKNLNPDLKIKLISLLAACAGPEGMVGGQTADIQGENQHLALEDLEYIHLHKTGKLLSYAVMAGAMIGGATPKQLALFETFSKHLGLAFQISDDILDVEGTEQRLGKPVGSDTGNIKSTYPSVLTLQGAKQQLEMHIEAAKQALIETNLQTSLLEEITTMIGARDH
ncbi:polyprenyl synthetase family protein [Bacillus sp. FJAT-50079]|uniref:polyprenyl synthetase family protein n=1 Tax=Bacillus sp. FJAT-50079 TaxID=2833577 RepID=UPI001BC8CA77|nr:farnesyl diphosphate synthase [Bacillus sp. FJAT-50079]MBS4209647.1 polyprenyl synthetase family protein [Bacillus sp. FJAT-50079]